MNTRTVVVALIVAALGARAGAQLIGPTPYLSAADSPFAGLGLDYFYIEDFEDGQVNTPGLHYKGSHVVGPGASTDSVDADDGAIDGLGRLGHSLHSDGFLLPALLSFDRNELGQYPTHVGGVFTDVGSVDSGSFGFGGLIISAWYADAPAENFGPFAFGDGAIGGGTAEDRFVGITHAGGLVAIVFYFDNSFDYEVDHVQYGYGPVPAPASGVVLALGGLAAARRRR